MENEMTVVYGKGTAQEIHIQLIHKSVQLANGDFETIVQMKVDYVNGDRIVPGNFNGTTFLQRKA